MGDLVYHRDARWNKPVVTLPGSEKWDLIDRYVVRNGFCADLCGQQMLFLDVSNHWISLVSKTAALRVSQIVGNEKASVNYVQSYEPYYNQISKASSANSASFVPVSVCVGTERLTIEVDEDRRELRFAPVPPFPIRRVGRIPDFVYGLCYQPADHVDIPEVYTFPGVGKVLEFIRPLFPDIRSMVTFMWIVGNAARDPVSRPRCLMMCGPGGSGKSTALRMATSALPGATNLIPDNILTRDFNGLGDKVAQVVVKSRLVTCYELDLDNKMVNMSMFKNITGGDYVKVGEFMSKAVCSFAIATNGLPDVIRQPEFMSDAISRRMVCVKMDVDTAEASFEPDPSNPVDKMDFLCACLYVRMIYSHLPISPDNLLLTLCGSLYFKATELVTEDRGVCPTVLEGKEVIALLSGLLGMTSERIVDRCRLVSMSSVESTPMGFIIKGLRPLRKVGNGAEVQRQRRLQQRTV